MITGSLCKAARALVEVSREKLARNSGVDKKVIKMFERGADIPADTSIASLKASLEELGAVFIPEVGSNGAGVRLKFSQSATDSLREFVNEGGPSRKDALP